MTVKKRTLLKVLLGLVVAGGLLFAGFVAGFMAYQPVMRWSQLRQAEQTRMKYLDKPAPDFEGRTLDGAVWKLSDQRGKVVVIDFMASWCGPCVGSYPVLKDVKKQYGDQVSLIGVSLDESEEDLREHLERYDLPWPTLFEAGTGWANSVARQYDVAGIPSIWIIDREGNVATLNTWEKQMWEKLNELLGPGEMLDGE